MAWNFDTVPAWPGHERNLMAPDFAAYRGYGVTEGEDCFWIPCGGRCRHFFLLHGWVTLSRANSAVPRQPRAQFCDVRQMSPMNNASIPVLRNVAMAWAGVHTMGSLSLNEVLRTIGTPVRSKKREISS